MNYPEKGRRNCGAEGLVKILIDKQQSLRIEQSLNEAWKNHLIIRPHNSSRRPVNTHRHMMYDLKLILYNVNMFCLNLEFQNTCQFQVTRFIFKHF